MAADRASELGHKAKDAVIDAAHKVSDKVKDQTK